MKPSDKAKYTGIPELSYLTDASFKNLIPALEAIQAFASGVRQIPAIAYGSPYDLTPGGDWYEKVFDEALEAEPRLFLYPFLVREWAKKNGYSRGGGGWRAHSALFFIYVYFVTILEILKKVGFIESLETFPETIPLDTWDRIFVIAELNEALLLMTDDILDRYFQDSTIREAVSLDVRKFLKRHEALNRHKSILLSWIENTILSPRNRNTIDYLTAALQEN